MRLARVAKFEDLIEKKFSKCCIYNYTLKNNCLFLLVYLTSVYTDWKANDLNSNKKRCLTKEGTLEQQNFIN